MNSTRPEDPAAPAFGDASDSGAVCRDCGGEVASMSHDGRTSMRIEAQCPGCAFKKVEYLCWRCVLKLEHQQGRVVDITIKLPREHAACLDRGEN